MIENPANGSPFYGAFRDLNGQAKFIVLPNGIEFGRGERGVSYGAGHIEEKDRGARARFIAENTGWDSYMDMLSGLGRELTNQNFETRSVNYNRYQEDARKRIDPQSLKRLNGVMFGQAKSAHARQRRHEG